MAEIYKSRPVHETHILRLKDKCSELKEKGIKPCMKVILVGNVPASLIYTRNKKKFCESFGAECEIIHLDEKIIEEDFLSEVSKISSDEKVHGCFVQLPLPKHLQHIEVGDLIPPHKDVDGFHRDNLNALLHGKKRKGPSALHSEGNPHHARLLRGKT